MRIELLAGPIVLSQLIAQPLHLLLPHTLVNMIDQCKRAKNPKKKSKHAVKGPTITIPKPSNLSTSTKSRPKPKPAYQGANPTVSNSELGLIVPQDEGGMVNDAIQALLGLGGVPGGDEGLESDDDEVEAVGVGKRKRRSLENEEGEGDKREEDEGEDGDEDEDETSEEGPEDEGECSSCFLLSGHL